MNKIQNKLDNLALIVKNSNTDFQTTMLLESKKMNELNEYINDNIENIKIKKQGNYIRVFVGTVKIAYFSLGNRKLKMNTDRNGFLIFSIIGKITCNGKTKLCSKKCYNNCRQYTATIEAKIKNAIFTKLDIFEKVTKEVCKIAKEKMKYNHVYVRIHEDGDFYDTKYYEKWNSISKSFTQGDYTFTAYTKDIDVIRINRTQAIGGLGTNVLIRFSLMQDTKQEVRDLVDLMGVPTYECLGVDKKDSNAKELFATKKNSCKCVGDCSICKKCYTSKVENIFTLMH